MIHALNYFALKVDSILYRGLFSKEYLMKFEEQSWKSW